MKLRHSFIFLRLITSELRLSSGTFLSFLHHTQKKTFARIQFAQETNSTSKSYSFTNITVYNERHLSWYYYIRPWLRAIDYTREKDCNRMTLLEFLRLIFEIIKIRFRIFFYLRFDSPKRKNLNIMA